MLEAPLFVHWLCVARCGCRVTWCILCPLLCRSHGGDCQTCASQLLHSSSNTSHLSGRGTQVQVPHLVRYKHNIIRRYLDKSGVQRQSNPEYIEVLMVLECGEMIECQLTCVHDR